MQPVNVYDFDGTIYNGDSSIDFYWFCLIRHPAILTCVFTQVRGALLYLLKLVDKTTFKSMFFCFLSGITNLDQTVEAFWNKYRYKVASWYMRQARPSDIIISASPAFLLQPICSEIGVRLIATRMDPHTGKIEGLNCHGAEKVDRLLSNFPACRIDCFYTDSMSDRPLMALASKVVLIKRGKPTQYDL